MKKPSNRKRDTRRLTLLTSPAALEAVTGGFLTGCGTWQEPYTGDGGLLHVMEEWSKGNF